MHRQYAGILGSVAFAMSALCGVAAGADAPAIVPRAIAMLLAFALVGAVVGRLALWTVEEGVSARLRDELADTGKKKS